MAYHVTKDLKAEIKVGGSLFLKDLMGLILFPAIMYFLTGAIVADGLKIVYIVYNVVVVLDLCQYFEHKKLKGYADFFNSSSSFCCGVI